MLSGTIGIKIYYLIFVASCFSSALVTKLFFERFDSAKSNFSLLASIKKLISEPLEIADEDSEKNKVFLLGTKKDAICPSVPLEKKTIFTSKIQLLLLLFLFLFFYSELFLIQKCLLGFLPGQCFYPQFLLQIHLN